MQDEESRKRAQRDLQAIKSREAAVRTLIENGVPFVDIGQFAPAQLGLRPVYCDESGRLWVDCGSHIERVGAPT